VSDPAERRLGWHGLAIAAVSFVIGLVASTIVTGIVIAFTGWESGQPLGFGERVAAAAGLWIGLLVAPLVASVVLKRGGPADDLLLRGRFVDVPIGVAAGLATSFLTGISSLWLSDADRKALEELSKEVVNSAQGMPRTVAIFIVLCVFTPLAEEVFFRGLLYRSLVRVTSVPVAVPIASLAFGLLHFSGQDVSGVALATQLAALSLFGAVLCLLTQWTGRLGPAICAHAAFNALTVIVLIADR
jgi:membrane protease YdiL (CAAX protease family)